MPARPGLERATLAAVLLLAGVSGLRLYIIGQVPITGDEAYHWQWSRHLAFGYYDHPPLMAWAVALFDGSSGTSVFRARLAFPLLGAAAAVFLYLLGRDIGGDARAGAIAAMLFLVAPLPAIGSMAIVPDGPLMAAWAGTLYFLHRALFKESRWAWPLAGVFLGLAILSKLIAAFLIPSLFLFLAASRDHRSWLRRREPYLWLLWGAAVASPFLIWNALHDWETVVYQFTLRLVVRDPNQPLINPRMLVDFAVYQTVALSPMVFVLALGVLASLVRRGLRGDARALFSAAFCLPVLGFFTLTSLRVRGGEHWPFVGYLSLFVGMAWAWSRFGRAYRRSLVAALAIAGAMTAGLFALLLKPALLFALASGGIDYHGINKGQSLPASELAEIYGYRPLGAKVRDTVEQMRRQRPTFVITDSYTLSSVLAFYGRIETHVARGSILGREYRRWDRFDTRIGDDALFVDLAPYGARPDIAQMLAMAFERVEPEPAFVTAAHGQTIRPFYLVRCYGLRRDGFQ